MGHPRNTLYINYENQPIIAYRYVLLAVEFAKWVIVAVPCPWELA